jgi:hypothetical protein
MKKKASKKPAPKKAAKKQTTRQREDFSQAAVRIVREATKDYPP